MYTPRAFPFARTAATQDIVAGCRFVGVDVCRFSEVGAWRYVIRFCAPRVERLVRVSEFECGGAGVWECGGEIQGENSPRDVDGSKFYRLSTPVTSIWRTRGHVTDRRQVSPCAHTIAHRYTAFAKVLVPAHRSRQTRRVICRLAPHLPAIVQLDSGRQRTTNAEVTDNY